MPRASKHTLDERERRLVQGVAEGKSRIQAAKDAGYSKSTAEKKSYAILQRPLVRSELTKALEHVGVTFDDIVRPLADALKAERSFVNARAGTIIKTKIPDHSIRLEAHDRVVALYGGVPKVGEATPTAHGLNLFVTVADGQGGRRELPPATLREAPVREPKMIGPRTTAQESPQQDLRLAVQVKESGPHNLQALKPDPALND